MRRNAWTEIGSSAPCLGKHWPSSVEALTLLPHLPSTSPPPTPFSFPQLKDKWGFRMTARYDMYAGQLARYVQHDFKPQVIRDPSLE